MDDLNSLPDLREIPVVILCGGRGTRLMEETELRPKPMVEIGGMPILWHIMKYYSCFGCRRFVLALGYKSTCIKRFFFEYPIMASDFTVRLDPERMPVVHRKGAEQAWEVTCIDTGVDTLKGGRIKRVAEHLDREHFMLTYGDGVGTMDMQALYRFHCSHGAVGTVTGVRPPSRFGEMRLEGDRVTTFEEKPQLSQSIINGGFFVFRRDFLDRLTEDDDCDFEFGPLQQLAHDGQLRVHTHDGFWQCMDNIREREYLEKLWHTGRAPWKIWDN